MKNEIKVQLFSPHLTQITRFLKLKSEPREVLTAILISSGFLYSLYFKYSDASFVSSLCRRVYRGYDSLSIIIGEINNQ